MKNDELSTPSKSQHKKDLQAEACAPSKHIYKLKTGLA